MSGSSSGRKRATDRHYSAEDQALDQISKEAEERIQARRQARAEAREIRMREIERQQKEEEEKQKRQEGIPETPKSYYKPPRRSISSLSGSRRGSNDSTDTDASSKDGRDPKDQVRDLKRQLRELEDKYKQAMVTNAQLDNTKTSHVFQIELLKEQIEEQEESLTETSRQYKDKSRDYEMLKRDFESLKLDLDGVKQFMELKDQLLKESGLVVVSSDEGQLTLTKCSDKSSITPPTSGSTLITEEAADLLKKAGDGTLDDKLRKILSEQKKTEEEVKTLTRELEEEKAKKETASAAPKTQQMNGPELQLYEVQREASKQIHEYKLKLQKAEQEITNLDGNVNRLETQVKRFKYDAEEAERIEDELKTDRRRLQRELRECQNQIEELQNQNKHLTKRLEKFRQNRTLVNP